MPYHPRYDVPPPGLGRRLVGPMAVWRWWPSMHCPQGRRRRDAARWSLVAALAVSVTVSLVWRTPLPALAVVFGSQPLLWALTGGATSLEHCACRDCLPELLVRRRYRHGEVDHGELLVAVRSRLVRRVPARLPGHARPAGHKVCAVAVQGSLVSTVDADAPAGAFVAALLERPGPWMVEAGVAPLLTELVAQHCHSYCSEELTDLEADAVVAWAPQLGTERAVATARAALD